MQDAWESLRELVDMKKVNPQGFSWYFSAGAGTQRAERVTRGVFGTSAMPSYAWFAEAASENVPGYRVEQAKSNRSSCKARGSAVKHTVELIDAGELRFGSMDAESGEF